MSTQHKSITVSFGSLHEAMAAKISLDSLRILGFVPVDRSLPFRAVIPMKIQPTSQFLTALAFAMLAHGLDAVAFAESDYILRAFRTGDSKAMLTICVPMRPLFEANSHRLNYPNFAIAPNSQH